jgi:hypothetical protein
MSFRIWTIFYVFALFAAAMATFGAIGIVAAAIVLLFWFAIYAHRRPLTVLEWICVCGIVLLLVALLASPVKVSYSLHGHCRSNLRNLALAVLGYEWQHGTLPPAYVDDRGAPIWSWRALVLPQLERTDVFEQIDFTKPWDSVVAPNNSAAASTDIDVFRCPSHPATLITGTTDYVAVTGERTAWPGHRGRKLKEITDPKSHTILLMEIDGQGISWAEPYDARFDQAVRLLTNPSYQVVHKYRPMGGLAQTLGKSGAGIHVAMADGSVHFLSLPLPKDLAVALLTIDGNEGDLHNMLDDYTLPRLDLGKCYSLGVFVLLAILPAAFMRRHKRNSGELLAAG